MEITEEQYLLGLKVLANVSVISIEALQRALKISFDNAEQIEIGAEEMGIISRPTKKNPSVVIITPQKIDNDIEFYRAGIKARMHDFNSVEGIRNILIPKYARIVGMISPVNNIEYILHRRATRHKKSNRMDLAIECLRKANEIMPYSNFQWTANDYLHLVYYLDEAGFTDEASREREKLQSKHPDVLKSMSACINEGNKNRIQQLSSLEYDLVQMTTHYPTCEKCAIMQGRVFSISGNDKRFPPLSIAYEEGTHSVHKGCKHCIAPWIENAYGRTAVFDMIEFSNRPFVDPRSQEEIALYEKQQYESLVADTDYDNYNRLCELLPKETPKSYGSYRRVKNANTANYQKLVNEAKEIGMDIDKYR